MSALSKEAPSHPLESTKPESLCHLLLVRLACAGGATRAQLVRDLGRFLSHKLSPAELRSAVDAGLARLGSERLIRDTRGRMRATEAGAMAAARYLGEKESHARAWGEQRDLWLVAKALGVDARKTAIRKALSRPEGLSALIVQRAYGLAMRQALSPSKLRSALALAALGRAFGENVKMGLNGKSHLTVQAARVLAGQLLSKPREFTTDGRLIAALSAECVGATRADIEMLRLALLRGLASGSTLETESDRMAPARAPRLPANDAGPPATRKDEQRPDLAQFGAGVLDAARAHAEGWPGSRKAFISQVWEAIRASHPEWGLSENEFKDMLAGAHRAGQIVLAGADLKNKQNLKEFEESATHYKNTVWHFVRVED